jgi:divalent metal cation (Fe/Co/Zn/Cd) transporter
VVRPGDEGLDAAEIAVVARVLAAGPSEVIGYRRLRARTAGGVRRIDVDVTVRRDATPVEIAHVRAVIVWALEDGLPDARVFVHLVRPAAPRRPPRSRRVP